MRLWLSQSSRSSTTSSCTRRARTSRASRYNAVLMARFIVRDFKWDDEGLEHQKQEIARLEKEEKELWVCAMDICVADVLRLSCFVSHG